MAQNRTQTFGPIGLTNVYTTNLISPAAAGGSANGYTPTASYLLLRWIRIINILNASHTFRLYVGATGANAAGTNFGGFDTIVAANSYVDVYPVPLRLEGTNGFLVGGADAGSALVLVATGEVGLV